MFHTIRIKNKGFYLGRDCPAEGIVVSDFIITVLRSMGADVEIYDPVEDADKLVDGKYIRIDDIEPEQVEDIMKQAEEFDYSEEV